VDFLDPSQGSSRRSPDKLWMAWLDDRSPPAWFMSGRVSRRFDMRLRSLLFLAAIVAVGAIGGTLYKWVDERGVTHYSDTPPPGQHSRRTETPAAKPPATGDAVAPSATDASKQADEAFRKRHAARQQQLEKDLRQGQRDAEREEIRSGARTPVPGATGAAPLLQRDVLLLLTTIDTGTDPACTRHTVTDTEWLESSRETWTAVERWTLDRCGKPVRYRITVTAAALLGTNFNIAAE
jgi:hypothetical protein